MPGARGTGLSLIIFLHLPRETNATAINYYFVKGSLDGTPQLDIPQILLFLLPVRN